MSAIARDIDEAIPHGAHEQCCSGAHAKLAHEIGTVGVDGLCADTKPVGYLDVGQSTGNTVENFELATGQPFAFVNLLKNPDSMIADHLLAMRHPANAVAKLFRLHALDEQPAYIVVDQITEHRRRGTARQNGKPCIGRPAPALEENFQATGTGHDEIDNGTIGLMALDTRYGLDAVARAPDYDKTVDSINGRHQTRRG